MAAIELAKRQLVTDKRNGHGNMRYYQFIMGIARFFSVCDSIQFYGDLTVGAGVGFTLSMSDYIMAGEIALNDIKKLMNMKTSKNQTKSYISTLRSVMEEVKNTVKSIPDCSVKSQKNPMSYTARPFKLLSNESDVPYTRIER